MKTNNITRICLITGNDETAIKNEANDIFAEIKNSFPEDVDTTVLDAEIQGVKDLQVLGSFLDSLKSQTLFSDKKIIWLKNISSLDEIFNSKKENELKNVFNEIVTTLAAEIKNINSAILINGVDISSKNPIYKIFAAEKATKTVNKMSSASKSDQVNIQNKIKEYLEKHDKSVDASAVEFLAMSLGTESGKFFNELDKLITFCWDKKQITLKDCREIISKTFEMATWAFAEAFASRNKKDALLTLNILLDKNSSTDMAFQTSETSIVFGVSKKIQEIIKAKASLEALGINKSMSYAQFQNVLENSPKNENTKFITSIHPYRAYKIFEQSLKFSEESLCKIVSAILDAHIELVSGSISKKITLENLVMKCC